MPNKSKTINMTSNEKSASNREIKLLKKRIAIMEEKFIESERMARLGMLAAEVAHDLNAPLASILGYAQLILQTSDENIPAAEDMRNIENAAKKCRDIVKNILMYARGDKNDRVPIDLRKFLEEVIIYSRTLFADKITIILDFPPSIPIIIGNPRRLHQLFLNLIKNACQAMNNKGKLEIIIQDLNPHNNIPCGIYVLFRDEGHGIPKGQINKIFDPFYSSKSPYKGTGIGLTLCKNITEEHKGEIRVFSKLGTGTIFSLYFPVAN